MTISVRDYLAPLSFGSMLGQITIHAFEDADTGLMSEMAIIDGLVIPMPLLQAFVLGHLHARPATIGIEDGDRLCTVWARIELPRSVLPALRSGQRAENIAGEVVSERIIKECSDDDPEERKRKVYALIKMISDKQREAKREPISVTGLEALFEDLPRDFRWPEA